MADQELSREDYQVGIICALAKERAAVEAMLDAVHPKLSIDDDHNVYTFGKMGKHNVVIASLRSGSYGLVSAANVAGDIRRSFPHLRFGLMVGIAGGMPRPNDDADIRLGDIVVGCGSGVPSIINYTAGKVTKDGLDLRGVVGEPPEILLNAITALEAERSSKGPTYLLHLSEMFKNKPRMNKPRPVEHYYNAPSVKDQLFDVPAVAADKTVSQPQEIVRQARYLQDPPDDIEEEPFIQVREEGKFTYSEYPKVFYGTIASADQLMKDAVERNRVYEDVLKQSKAKILCFEMEAFGIVKGWPCLVIRGICDYCDSHKNDEWQNFASATAASYAKDLLAQIPPESVRKTKAVKELVQNVTNNNTSYQFSNSGSGPSNINFGGNQRNYSQNGSGNKMFNGENVTFHGTKGW